MTKNFKKILFVHLSGLGNTILLYPTLKNIDDNKFHLELICKNPSVKKWLELTDLNIKIYYTPSKANFLITLSKLFIKSIFNKFHFVINTDQLYELYKFKYAFINILNSKNFFHFSIKSYISELDNLIYFLEEKKIFLKILDNLNIYSYSDNLPFYKFLTKNEKSNTNQLKQIGFVIGSGATQKWKRWPIENYLSLINKFLISKKKVKVFFGPDELNLYYKFLDYFVSSGQVELIKSDDLKKIMKKMSECSLIIGGDSGLIHLASSMDISTLTLFGPTSVIKNSQLSNKFKFVHKGPCFADSNKVCENCTLNDITPTCLLNIKPDLVYKICYDNFLLA